jgi:hypothetical protein
LRREVVATPKDARFIKELGELIGMMGDGLKDNGGLRERE